VGLGAEYRHAISEAFALGIKYVLSFPVPMGYVDAVFSIYNSQFTIHKGLVAGLVPVFRIRTDTQPCTHIIRMPC